MLKHSFTFIFVLTAGIIIYSLILISAPPYQIGIYTRYDYISILPILSFIFLFINNLSEVKNDLCLSILVLSVFALSLSGLWNSGQSDLHLLGGILPVSDGRIYYQDALRFLHGYDFSSMSSRRPISTVFLSVFLGLTSCNLKFSLAILTAITAISCFFAIREVRNSHGRYAGLMMFLLLFLFYRRFIGTCLTEHIGLSMGALGFTFLWRGSGKGEMGKCVAGVFLLTVALNARAGAFFSLPLIVAWGMWAFRGKRLFSVSFVIYGSAAVVMGFALNYFILEIVSDTGMVFSNFPYVFYGLITGGDWKSYSIDHPELYMLTEAELAKRMMSDSLAILKENPYRLFWGILRAWRAAIIGTEGPVFSFIWIRSTEFTNIINCFSSNGLAGLKNCLQLYPYGILNFISVFLCFILLNILSFLSIIRIQKYFKNPQYSLLMFAGVGIFLSIPFAPPWDGDTFRVYASTIPIIAAFPMFGLVILQTKLKYKGAIGEKFYGNGFFILYILSGLLIVTCSAGPLFIKHFLWSGDNKIIGEMSGNEMKTHVLLLPESSIFISDKKNSDIIPSDIFQEGLALFRIGFENIAQNIEMLYGNVTLMATLDFVTGNLTYLRFDWIEDRKCFADIIVKPQTDGFFLNVERVEKVDCL